MFMEIERKDCDDGINSSPFSDSSSEENGRQTSLSSRMAKKVKEL
jgi:hypothetical protein